MHVLDLFSGSGSVAAAFRELGADVVTLDITNKFNREAPVERHSAGIITGCVVGYFR